MAQTPPEKDQRPFTLPGPMGSGRHYSGEAAEVMRMVKKQFEKEKENGPVQNMQG